MAIGVGAVIVLAAALFFLSGPLSTFDLGGDCEWQTLELDGQTFSSKEEVKQFVNSKKEGAWERFQKAVEMRVRDGVVQYKPPSCGKREVSTGGSTSPT